MYCNLSTYCKSWSIQPKTKCLWPGSDEGFSEGPFELICTPSTLIRFSCAMCLFAPPWHPDWVEAYSGALIEEPYSVTLLLEVECRCDLCCWPDSHYCRRSRFCSDVVQNVQINGSEFTNLVFLLENDYTVIHGSCIEFGGWTPCSFYEFCGLV